MKKPKRLTDAYLKSIQKPGTEADVSVPGRDGLYVRRQATGALTFRFRFTPKGTGRRIWYTLGTYGEGGISIATAFEMHAQSEKEVAMGLDPRLEQKRRIEAAQRADEKARAKGKITIRNVIAEWAWHHARPRRKRPREAVRLLKSNFESWKGRAVSEFKKRDAVVLLDKIVARDAPVVANRLCDLANQVFTVCVSRDLIENNPFLGIIDPGGEEEARERHLKSEEIRIVWKALDAADSPVSRHLGLALRLLLLTGQRSQELRLARVTDFDLENRIWTVPPESIKTVRRARKTRKKKTRVRREHLVPLSNLAVELLKELIPFAGPTGRLLPNHRRHQKPDAPIDRKTLYKALANEIKVDKAGYETLFGLDTFAPHDFRRTLSTGLTSQGIPLFIVGKVLNHSEKEKKSASTTEKVYDKYQYLKEKRAALDRWSQIIRQILAGEDPLNAQAEAA